MQIVNRKSLILLVKLSISLLLCYTVLRRVDLSSTLSSLLNKKGVICFAVAMLPLFIQAALAALRLRLIVRAVAGNCRLIDGLVIWMSGLFVSQTMVTIVAGDLVRAYQLRQLGNPGLLSGNCILIDRLIGVSTLLLLSFLSVPFLSGAVSDQAVGDIMVHVFVNLLVGAVFSLIAVFVLRKYIRAVIDGVPLLKTVSNYVVNNLNALKRVDFVVPAILLSALMHLCNVFCMYIFAQYFEVVISFWSMTYIVLPAMFIMLLPISFAGWGIREGSMVIGFSLLGIDAGPAVAVSVSFGMALLLISLPGALGLVVSKWKPFVNELAADSANKERIYEI